MTPDEFQKAGGEVKAFLETGDIRRFAPSRLLGVASPCSALADVARVVMRENGRTCVWYGDPQLCQDIYKRWGGKHTHPLNTIATVVSSLARSKKWKRDGYISHPGRRYPVYTPNSERRRKKERNG